MPGDTPSDPALVSGAVISANAINLVLAPAFALAQQYTSTAHALGLQTIAQQQAQQHVNLSTQAVLNMACAQLLSVDVAAIVTKTP